MNHVGSINPQLVVVIIGVIIWVIRGIASGIKQISRRTGAGPALPGLQAVPPSEPALLPVQVLPERALRLEGVRPMPRQPSAGGPAVAAETNRRDFQRQEQELEASEPAALRTSLTSAPLSTSTAPGKALFSNTDDLIRAVILQEVLGPPLSRRSSPPPPANPQ